MCSRRFIENLVLLCFAFLRQLTITATNPEVRSTRLEVVRGSFNCADFRDPHSDHLSPHEDHQATVHGCGQSRNIGFVSHGEILRMRELFDPLFVRTEASLSSIMPSSLKSDFGDCGRIGGESTVLRGSRDQIWVLGQFGFGDRVRALSQI
jgi:hypothetical protein